MSKPTDIGSVKIGHHIIIDGEPCRIVSYDHSKPGKHGSAKARIVAMGVFDEVKRSIVSPVSARIEVPCYCFASPAGPYRHVGCYLIWELYYLQVRVIGSI